VPVMQVTSRLRDYEVHFLEDLPSFFEEIRAVRGRMTVCDRRVWDLYRAELEPLVEGAPLVFLEVHEDRKNLGGVTELYDALLGHRVRRNWTLLSIGGGITQDLTGFVASTLYRGLDWVYVPTTLLAQADSCIGSKTSLNYRDYKNLLGTFYPPSRVFLWPGFLRTLARADFYSGLGEAVKLHLMGGKAATQEILGLLPAVERLEIPALLLVIQRSLQIKRGYFEGDEFDTGRRRLLNFGHCLGHALESVSNFEIPHGQAVVVGMTFAGLVARARGLLSDASFELVWRSLLRPTLVAEIRPEHLEVSALLQAMAMDKKREGAGLPLIMMAEGHKMLQTQDLHPEEVEAGVAGLRRLLAV
jgi:3-dehydroquinate synthase